jgi:AAA ATPase domain
MKNTNIRFAPVTGCRAGKTARIDRSTCDGRCRTMHIESLKLTNFRCFGPETVVIPMAETFTAFVGDNGAGKTAIATLLSPSGEALLH